MKEFFKRNVEDWTYRSTGEKVELVTLFLLTTILFILIILLTNGYIILATIGIVVLYYAIIKFIDSICNKGR